MPDPADIHGILEEAGALKRGHFQLSSGLHSDRYCQCAALFERPDLASQLAETLGARIASVTTPDVVLAPALGGILWGYELARALGAISGRPVRSLFAERSDGGRFELRRGFAIHPGERVLLAEDVVTTGGSVLELAPLIERAGGAIAGFAVVADRSRGGFDPGPSRPVFALTTLDFQTWDPASCPMCAKRLPIDKPGSRRHAHEGAAAR